MTASAAPGPWLRLTALGGVAAAALVVSSGELGLAHRALALVALPPLVAVAVSAALAHRALRVPAWSGLGLMLATFALGGLVSVTGAAWARGLHVGAAVATLAATALTAAAAYRVPHGAAARVPRGSVRDYVTLTKPRIMSLLLLTGACGMAVGAGGLPPLLDLGVLLVGLERRGVRWSELVPAHIDGFTPHPDRARMQKSLARLRRAQQPT